MNQSKYSKDFIRQAFIAKRNLFNPNQVMDLSTVIQNKVIRNQHFTEAKYIHCYISINKEVDTSLIIKKAISKNGFVIVPSFNKAILKHYILKNLETFKKIKDGLIKVESLEEFVDLKNLDLVILPTVGFDENKNRLGMGGGWYDRLLSLISPTVYKLGLGFTSQKHPKELPTESHDIKLNEITSEN